MAIVALAIPTLWTAIKHIFFGFATYLVTKGFRKAGVYIAFVSLVMTLFFAFLATIYGILSGLMNYAPYGVAFGLGVFPPSTSFFISSYLTVLVSKRAFDWFHLFAGTYVKI